MRLTTPKNIGMTLLGVWPSDRLTGILIPLLAIVAGALILSPR